MPNVGGPTANLSDFIAAVQTNVFELMLSKSDAAITYQTKSDAATMQSNTDTISEEVKQSQIADGNLLSNISGIAPRGQGDFWQLASGIGGSCMLLSYISSINRVYGTSGVSTPVGAFYSSDGGVTWSSVIFDIAPTMPVIIGYDGVGTFVGLTFEYGNARIYTSGDGINFTSVGTLTSILKSYSIARFNGLFIAGVDTDSTHRISTSPDGIIWTPRVTPAFGSVVNGWTFETDGTQLIAVCDAYSGAMRTFDGVEWSSTSGITTGMSTIAYSSEQKLWLCLSPTGIGFTSTDGLNWSNIGTVSPVTGAIGLIWVGNNINRWYLSVKSTALNYSIATTDDPRTTPFFMVELDGAVANSMAYSQIRYIPLYNRFIIGLTSIGVAYSTPRIRDIKASSDNIRVRNCPVVTSKYSGIADFSIASTTTETSVVPSASIGSLAYQAAQPVGMKIKISLVMQNTSAAGDTLTLRFKTQAGTLLTHAIPVAGGASNLVTRIKASLVVRTATISCCSTVMQSGLASTSVYAAPGFNPAILNTFSVTAQWGAALSTCTVNQFNLLTEFINGA